MFIISEWLVYTYSFLRGDLKGTSCQQVWLNFSTHSQFADTQNHHHHRSPAWLWLWYWWLWSWCWWLWLQMSEYILWSAFSLFFPLALVIWHLVQVQLHLIIIWLSFAPHHHHYDMIYVIIIFTSSSGISFRYNCTLSSSDHHLLLIIIIIIVSLSS